MKKTEDNKKYSRALTEHFFRNEYGKIVAVITGFIGPRNVETAEDIVQETLLKAVDYWQHHGIPENPQGWLYTTAKNITLNNIRRKKLHDKLDIRSDEVRFNIESIEISEELIPDEQLKMMFVCCHPSISENSQIALVLKILCGFSISEIANAFFNTNETINKRLVRGRKQLRDSNIVFKLPKDINQKTAVVLKTIYLLFNEGYSPSHKNELIRHDLCLEAIRLTELLVSNVAVKEKAMSHALLALMYLNASRFESRMNSGNIIVEMKNQDRTTWNQELINKGIQHLNLASEGGKISPYLIMATISANYCVASSYEETKWEEVLQLYDHLITIEDSAIARLNRSVVLSKVEGTKKAILELKKLKPILNIENHHLFHATLAEFYRLENKIEETKKHLKKAISLSKNERDINFLQKKLLAVVPNF